MLDLPGETVTVQRGTQTSTGRRNDTTTDWSTPAEHDIADCLIAPGSSLENHDGRDGVTADIAVYAPAGADVLSTDRLIVRGEPYDVEGEPAVWSSPGHYEVDGVVIAANRSEG